MKYMFLLLILVSLSGCQDPSQLGADGCWHRQQARIAGIVGSRPIIMFDDVKSNCKEDSQQ